MNSSVGVYCASCGRTLVETRMYRINKRKRTQDGTRTGLCYECKQAINRPWNAAHRERLAELRHAWYLRVRADPERWAERKRRMAETVRRLRARDRLRAFNAVIGPVRCVRCGALHDGSAMYRINRAKRDGEGHRTGVCRDCRRRMANAAARRRYRAEKRN